MAETMETNFDDEFKGRLHIRGGMVENQRPAQVLFRIGRCLRTIYRFIFEYINISN